MAPGLIDCKMDGGFCRGGILPESTRPKKHVENHAFFNDFKGCHRVPFTREKVPKSAVFTILEALQAHQVRTIVFRFRPMGCNLFWAQAAGSWLYTMGVPFFLQYSNLWYWTPRIFCVFWSNVVDISPPRFSFSEAKTIRQKSAFFHRFRFSKPVLMEIVAQTGE